MNIKTQNNNYISLFSKKLFQFLSHANKYNFSYDSYFNSSLSQQKALQFFFART